MKEHKVVLSVATPWHPGNVEVTPEALAEALGDLRYDSLAEYLVALSKKLQKDSENDGGRGQGQLSYHLSQAAFEIEEARFAIERAWKICDPYMKENKG